MRPLSEDRLGETRTTLEKVSYLVRNPKLNALLPMVDHIEKSFDGTVYYDVYHGGDEKLEDLHYTEVFAQGLLVTACNDLLRYISSEYALDSDEAPINSDVLLSAYEDKYESLTTRAKPTEAVVFLPGANLLETHVNWELVYSLHLAGALIKPHPVTSPYWLDRITRSFPGSIIDVDESALAWLNAADAVYVPTCSELGLIATLKNKRVEIIDANDPCVARNIYRQFYCRALLHDEPKAALEKILGSRYSGFLPVGSSHERIDETLSAIKELHYDHFGNGRTGP